MDFDAETAERARHQLGRSATFAPAKGGKVRATIKVKNLDNLASWLLRFGDGAMVVAPEGARAIMSAKLKGILAKAAGEGEE